MRSSTAGALGGLIAGAITSGVMMIGRDAGWLKPTLSENAQDWLDETFGARKRLGDDGVTLLEQGSHYAASAGFGAAYGAFRPYVPLPGVVSGALFGAGLYAFGVAGVLPEIGMTKGEPHEEPGVSTQRFVIHLLFGAVMGLASDALNDRSVKIRRHVERVRRPEPEAPASAD